MLGQAWAKKGVGFRVQKRFDEGLELSEDLKTA